MISVKVDISGLERRMQALHSEQVPFALKEAINKTAALVVEAEKKEMRNVFDRPRQYTLNSVAIFKGATKQNPRAIVNIKNIGGKGVPASKYLAAQVKGGTRRMKRFEKALQMAGAMPPGFFAVPGDAARMDAGGNMEGGQIVQILAFFKAFPENGYKANMTDKGRKKLAKGTKKQPGGFVYFVGQPGKGLPLGIWQRFTFPGGGALKPVLIFVPNATYQPRFDFYGVARKTVEREFPKQFKIALAGAIKTAR